MIQIRTAHEVLTVLGPELIDIARKYSVTSQVVYGWRQRGGIPSRYFLRMQADLQRLGYSASPQIWGVEDAA